MREDARNGPRTDRYGWRNLHSGRSRDERREAREEWLDRAAGVSRRGWSVKREGVGGSRSLEVKRRNELGAVRPNDGRGRDSRLSYRSGAPHGNEDRVDDVREIGTDQPVTESTA